MGLSYHSSPGITFQCSPTLSSTPVLILPHLIQPVTTENVAIATGSEKKLEKASWRRLHFVSTGGHREMDISERSNHI